MRSSLVKQLAIHCSLLLVKTSYTEEGRWTTSQMDIRKTAYSKFMSENIAKTPDSMHLKIQYNLKKFFNGSLLTIKNWNQEKTFEDANPGVVEKSISIEKWFKFLLKGQFGLNLDALLDRQILAHILGNHPSKLFIDLCNYILYSFRSLGVNDSINGVLNAKLAELVNGLGNVNEEISEMIRLEKGRYLLLLVPSESALGDIMEEAEASKLEQLKKMNPEQQQQQLKKMYAQKMLVGLQAKLDYLYLEKCAPALFTIQSYLELLMEVPSETNKGNIAIYSDLFGAYSVLESISTLLFKLPTILKFEFCSIQDYREDYTCLSIPTFRLSEHQLKDFDHGKKITKIFEEVCRMSSIKDLKTDISKDINDILAKLKEKNLLSKEFSSLSTDLKLATKWLAFMSYEDNSSRENVGN